MISHSSRMAILNYAKTNKDKSPFVQDNIPVTEIKSSSPGSPCLNCEIYCCVIFYEDGPRLLRECLSRIRDAGMKIISVDGSFKEYLKANNCYREKSIDGCQEVAREFSYKLIIPPSDAWDDEVAKRNAYVKAVPNGSYFMWIDADELLPEGLKIGKLTEDFYLIPEILHRTDGTTQKNPRLRVAKKYPDLEYRYQHCRMYRMEHHRENDLNSGLVVRSCWTTSKRWRTLVDINGKEVYFDHYPYKRPKARQEEKERFYKIRKEAKYPY